MHLWALSWKTEGQVCTDTRVSMSSDPRAVNTATGAISAAVTGRSCPLPSPGRPKQPTVYGAGGEGVRGER